MKILGKVVFDFHDSVWVLCAENLNKSTAADLDMFFFFFFIKMLHRGGSFINSLLYLEEMGFRSSSPSVKKIAFFAWKSLIDNFALNPGESNT